MTKLILTIEKTHTEKKEVSIPVPSFWKDPSVAYDEYIAILNENTVVRLCRFNNGDDLHLRNCTLEQGRSMLIKAASEYNPCTEEDFMQAHDETWEAMRQMPKEFGVDNWEAHKNYERENSI